MNKLLVIVFAAFAFALLGDDVVYQDEDVRRTLSMSCCVIDNSSKINRMRNHALSVQCGNDTNRFARIVCELAHTNNVRMARAMIGLLSTYGSAEHVPFLVSQTTNEVYAARAINSIFRIEGATSNTIAVVDEFLSRTNTDFEVRTAVCKDMLGFVKLHHAGDATWTNTLSCVMGYAPTANRYVSVLDSALMDFDPSYSNSHRRLSVLRSVNSLGVSAYQIDYVTNAINELVAYPEENLPE